MMPRTTYIITLSLLTTKADGRFVVCPARSIGMGEPDINPTLAEDIALYARLMATKLWPVLIIAASYWAGRFYG